MGEEAKTAEPIKLMDFIVQRSFRFTENLGRKRPEFPCTPPPNSPDRPCLAEVPCVRDH